MPSFRIVTYNIHKALGLDGRRRVERIADVLREIEADVVALQEVMGGQGEALARELGYFLAFGVARQHRGAAYGNATLSRWRFEGVSALEITVAGREPRVALRTDLRVHGALLHVFNLHLGTSLAERRMQAERLVGTPVLRAADLAGGRVVLGDFNEWTEGAVTRALRREFPNGDLRGHLRRERWWIRAFPALLPLLSLDHIYSEAPFRIERAWHHRSRLAYMASDHLPLVAELAAG